MSVTQEIYDKYDALTKKQQSIADYIIKNSECVGFLSLKELSVRAAASEVSVLRFCHALGFENFVSFKEAFRTQTQRLMKNFSKPDFLQEHFSVKDDEDKNQIFQQICTAEFNNFNHMLNGLNSDDVFKCAEKLLSADEVMVFGHDASKSMADYMCHRLAFLRINATAVKLGDNSALKSALARMKKNDFAILFSFPPYHMPVTNVAKYAELRGANVITITDSYDSPAVTADGQTFICRTNARFFYNSQTVPIALINVITSCIAAKMGKKIDEILAEEAEISSFMDI